MAHKKYKTEQERIAAHRESVRKAQRKYLSNPENRAKHYARRDKYDAEHADYLRSKQREYYYKRKERRKNDPEEMEKYRARHHEYYLRKKKRREERRKELVELRNKLLQYEKGDE